MKSEGKSIQSTTLIITGEDLVPSEVSSLLGLEPKRFRQKGTVPPDMRPDGALRFPGRISESGLWKVWIDEILSLSLEEQIEYWCGKIEYNREGFRIISERGYQIILDCYIDPGTVTTYELKPALLECLASADIILNITVNVST